MSDYVDLMQRRKAALLKRDEALAQELFEAAQELVRAGLVFEDEFIAGAYL